MAILDLGPQAWRDALGISPGQEPVALILEGTWWRERATKARLALLQDVRDTAFPEMYLGRWNGLTIAYCCAYGAARAVEPAHVFAQMGTPLLIQIGTCGAMDGGLATGTVMVPDTALGRDGVSAHYHGDGALAPKMDLDLARSARARVLLGQRGVPVAGGAHLTWTSLFAQTDALCAGWAAEGLRTVDMETAAVAAVAARFGRRAVALLTVWDALAAGKTFLEPLTSTQAQALALADKVIFDVALDLAAETALARAA
jgi:purine-nucleoside phosphorylase